MLFSVRDLEIKPNRFDRSFAAGEIDFLEEGLSQASPLKTSGTAEYLGSVGEIHVRGEFHVKLSSECDRCLVPASFDVDRQFDLLYQPAETLETGEEVSLKQDDTEMGFFDGEGVTLEEILREQVLLALPAQRLCRADCKGLCPSCRANLNKGPCGCAPQAPVEQNPWQSALSEIRVKSK
jgi:uncharacterized protein